MYSVKEFCNIVGVPFSTLRYYERIKLLNPEKKKTNNYRIYNKEDIKTVNIFRYYRSLGIETAEAVCILKSNNVGDIFKNSLISRENKIIQEMFCLNRQLKAMKQMEESLKLQDTGEILICDEEKIFFIPSIKEGEAVLTEYAVIAKWSELLPITMHGRVLPSEFLASKNIPIEIYQYGIAIRERDSCLLEAEYLRDAKALGHGKVLKVYVEILEENMKDNKQIQKALRYIRENDYEIIDDIFLEALPLCLEGQRNGEIVRIPIKKREEKQELQYR
ncbi:MAG: MerR family transcriptional regulator [bacterium]|nr:MerR family transcriptional regulator [bacterium]